MPILGEGEDGKGKHLGARKAAPGPSLGAALLPPLQLRAHPGVAPACVSSGMSIREQTSQE